MGDRSAAADLLDKPGAWTKKVSARDASGKEVDPVNPNAVCWCMCGAIDRARFDLKVPFFTEPSYDLCADVFATAGFSGDQVAVKFNDLKGRTQAEVIAALRSASCLATEGEVG